MGVRRNSPAATAAFAVAACVWIGMLAILLGPVPARTEASSCQTYKVVAPALNISPEPRGDATFVDVLDHGDLACVMRTQTVGDRDWAFIAFVTKQNERRSINGWANLHGLQLQPDAAAPSAPPLTSPSPPPQPPQQSQSEPAPVTPESEQVLRYEDPIPFGPYPVRGQTLDSLAHGVPTFAPFEELPESEWKVNCSSCHQWSRETLCPQAQIYAKDPRMVLRIQHPYGGPFKLALMRWAKTGCQ